MKALNSMDLRVRIVNFHIRLKALNFMHSRVRIVNSHTCEGVHNIDGQLCECSAASALVNIAAHKEATKGAKKHCAYLRYTQGDAQYDQALPLNKICQDSDTSPYNQQEHG